MKSVWNVSVKIDLIFKFNYYIDWLFNNVVWSILLASCSGIMLLLLLLICIAHYCDKHYFCVNICDGWLRLYLQEKQPFERIEVTRDQALEMFSDNKFKASITFFSSLRVRWGVDKLLVFMILSIVFWITSSYYLSHVSYFLPPIFFISHKLTI